jgi:glycosyltransferase involved in cell wall biosynthesis
VLVTVLINNYNYGRFLRECIASALNQTYAEMEVVVVDDGSTDDSVDIIREFGTSLVPVLKQNGGQASAYNAGFRVSRGDVVCFLDSDDTLYPDAVERALSRFDEDKTAAKIQWPLRVTDSAGQPTGLLSTKRQPPEGDLREMIIREGPFYDADLHTGALYARWLLNRIFPVPEGPYRNGADVYVTTLAPVFGSILNLAEPLGTYRHHNSNNYAGQSLDDARIRNYIRRFDANCEALKEHLGKMNLPADRERWKQLNFNYLWPSRLLAAKRDIADLLPAGNSYILVDGLEWGGDQLIEGRRALPFIERNGMYWGAPADEQTAIEELERLRIEQEASVIFFWWTTFWWMNEYPGLFSHLRRRYPQILNTDYLLAFDLANPSCEAPVRETLC